MPDLFAWFLLATFLNMASPDSAVHYDTSAASGSETKPVIVVHRGPALKSALRAFESKDYARAEESAYMVWKAYPHDTAGMIMLGAARIRQGKPERAIEVFQSYIDQHPLEAQGHFYLGLTCHLMNDRARASASYRTALLLNPDHIPARANLRQLDGQ